MPRLETIHRAAIELDGKRVVLGVPADLLERLRPAASAEIDSALPTPADFSRTVNAPIAGNLLAWSVEEGAQVEPGDVVATMQAMKMEIQVVTGLAGRIRRLATVGTFCEADVPLAEIESEPMVLSETRAAAPLLTDSYQGAGSAHSQRASAVCATPGRAVNASQTPFGADGVGQESLK